MIKKDYDNKFAELFRLYETDEVLTLEIRKNRMIDIISFGREYNAKYKVPYKHHFMGKPIKITNIVLDYFNQIVKQAENYDRNT